MMSAPRGRQHSWSLRSVGDGSGIRRPSVAPESLSPECVCVCARVCAHVCRVCICVYTYMPYYVCVCVYMCAHVCHVCTHVYHVCAHVCHVCAHVCHVVCVHVYAVLYTCMPCVCTCMPCVYTCMPCCVCAHVCRVCVHKHAMCVCPRTPSNARSNPIPALTSFQGSLCGGTSLEPRSSVAHAPPCVGAPARGITEGRWGVTPAAMPPLPVCHVPHQSWNS